MSIRRTISKCWRFKARPGATFWQTKFEFTNKIKPRSNHCPPSYSGTLRKSAVACSMMLGLSYAVQGNFWEFHVTHFVDALDEGDSDVLRAPDDSNMVLMINRHVFQPARLTADWMFKLPQIRGRGEIYVTEPFVNLILASGLTGLKFKRIWPHSRGS